MALREKYVNPFTDFGFKKLFGIEPNENVLKYYRDMKNVLDTSFEDGKAKKKVEIAQKALARGYSPEEIAELTGLTIAEIEGLKTQD